MKVLLLPISRGANGLNLVEASHVLLVEPILNPAQVFLISNYLILLIKAGTSNLYMIISISLYYSFFLCFSLSETIHLSLSFSIFIYLFTGAPSNWSNPQDWTEEDNCCSQVRNIETSCENFFPSFLSTRNGISFYFPSCISCGLIICGSGSPIFDECGSSPDLGH